MNIQTHENTKPSFSLLTKENAQERIKKNTQIAEKLHSAKTSFIKSLDVYELGYNSSDKPSLEDIQKDAFNKIDDLFKEPRSAREFQKSLKKICLSQVEQQAKVLREADRFALREATEAKVRNPSTIEADYTTAKTVPQDINEVLLDKYLTVLENPGWKGTLLRMAESVANFAEYTLGISLLYRPTSVKVAAVYRQVQRAVQNNIHDQPIENLASLPKIFQEKLINFKNRKINVLAIPNPKETGTLLFNKAGIVNNVKEAAKQLKSYSNQLSTTQVRGVIKEDGLILPATQSEKFKTYLERNDRPPAEQKTFSIDLTPVNARLDEKLGLTNTFGEIFGEHGVASSDYRNKHGVNMFVDEVALPVEGKEANKVSVLRQGVNAGRGYKNKAERREQAKQKALDTLTAAVALQISRMAKDGKSVQDILEEYANQPLTQKLVSTSLVTPDVWRGSVRIFKSTDDAERNMLAEQIAAFKALAEDKDLKVIIEGKEIKIKFEPICFNYGVNNAAVSYKMGTILQRAENRSALKKLNDEVKALLKTDNFDEKQKNEIKNLIQDIKTIDSNALTYTLQGNPYEITAKIQALTGILSAAQENMQGAANCMSGKDRTGILLAAIKAEAALKGDIGHWPTHAELIDPKIGVQDRFVEHYITMLTKGGGLDITELNAGTKGYKVQNIAMLYPNNPVWQRNENKEIFEQLKGWSNTTSA